MEIPLHVWEGKSAEEWQHRWHVGRVDLFKSVSSTNDAAISLAAHGAPHFSVVVADHQTQGRGRGGSAWHATAEHSLLLSVLLRVPRAGSAPGCAPIRIGLAVAEAIADVSGADTRVKWPNDVVIAAHGKVAGVLCESSLAPDRTGYVVAGIGINVLQRPAEFPAALQDQACSVLSATGNVIRRSELAGAILERVRLLDVRLTDRLTGDELHRLARHDALRGHPVVCEAAGRAPVSGIACGVADDGALQIERAGETVSIYSGTVRLAGSHAYPGSRE